MPNTRTISQDEITQHLFDLLTSQEEEMRDIWKVYAQETDGSGKHLTIFQNLQEQLTYTPAIEIIETGSENNIYSIGTQEEKFNFDIIVTVTNNHPVESRKFLRVVAHEIFDILNDFRNRSYTVPGKTFCIYYSEATNIDYGFRRGKGLLSAKMTYFAKLLKPNRYGTATPPTC